MEQRISDLEANQKQLIENNQKLTELVYELKKSNDFLMKQKDKDGKTMLFKSIFEESKTREEI